MKLDSLSRRPVPDIVWEVVIAIFATQIAFSVVRILQVGGRPVFIEPSVFLVLVFFAAIGAAGGIFAFVYIAVYAVTRALVSAGVIQRKPKEAKSPAIIIPLPGERIAG